MPHVSLPSVLCVLMVVDQVAQAMWMARNMSKIDRNNGRTDSEAMQFLGISEPYRVLEQAARVASLEFLAEVLAASGKRRNPNIIRDYDTPEIWALTSKCCMKVLLGTQLRLWFKISLLTLLKEAGVYQVGFCSTSAERMLVLAISTSFLHVMTGTYPVFQWFVQRLTTEHHFLSDDGLRRFEISVGTSVQNVDVKDSWSLFGSRKTRLALCFAWLAAFFPAWASAVRFAGVYLCASHNFAFSSLGCVPALANATAV